MVIYSAALLRISLFLAVYGGLVFTGQAQITSVSKNSSCTCLETFDALRDKIRMNYVGYALKVTPVTQNSLEALTDSLRQSVKRVSGYQCLLLLNKWTQWFGDKHLAVRLDPTMRQQAQELFANAPRLNITEAEARKYLSKSKLDPIVGIWEDKTFRVAIIRRGKKFIGITLQADGVYWSAGHIKLEAIKLKQGYQVLQYSTIHDSFTYYVESIIIHISHPRAGRFSAVSWTRTYPETHDAVKLEVMPAATFRRLDSLSGLLMVSSADIGLKPRIDSLIAANRTFIESCNTLMLDMRDNRGGLVPTLYGLLPFLYTNPIINAGSQILSTPDNNDDLEAAIQRLSNNPELQEPQRLLLRKLRANPGKLVVEPDDTFKLEKIPAQPKHIIILVNNSTASAAEIFLQMARQSTKVRVYGQPTYGALYLGDLAELRLTCRPYMVYVPTTANSNYVRNPSLPESIQPDVFVPPGTADWVGYALKHASKNP